MRFCTSNKLLGNADDWPVVLTLSSPSVKYTKRKARESAKKVGIGWIMKDFFDHTEGFELIFQGHSLRTRHDLSVHLKRALWKHRE